MRYLNLNPMDAAAEARIRQDTIRGAILKTLRGTEGLSAELNALLFAEELASKDFKAAFTQTLVKSTPEAT